MNTKKALPITTVLLILALALAAVGVGYGLWSKTLFINGTVQTGKLDAVFDLAFTDDDTVVDNAQKDAGDTGNCAIGTGSCDPKEFGPNPDRYDKGVGQCAVRIDPRDPEILHVRLANGYPSYHCTVWYDILNNGTIPVKIQALNVFPDNFINGTQVTVGLSDLFCGQQIDPFSWEKEIAQGDVEIHVEQAAAQDFEYTFDAELWLVQWNEFDATLCPQ